MFSRWLRGLTSGGSGVAMLVVIFGESVEPADPAVGPLPCAAHAIRRFDEDAKSGGKCRGRD